MKNGMVYLVGAGPGDPKLLTIRGLEILEFADVVLYDALIGDELLKHCRADAELVFVGKRSGQHALTQDEINARIIEFARQNNSVCRLKGGDPFVFGRGGEEVIACFENDIPFEIVPGISSAIAAPAYAGIPVTHREAARSFAVVTGHTKSDDAPPENLPLADTLVVLMGVRALPKIVAALLKRGQSASTPVAVIRWGTTAQQQVVTGTLETIESEVARANLKTPALIVIGEVVKLREKFAWFDSKSNRPLWGKTVVVTRAREQASSLVVELKTHGARVLECPTIKIEALSEREYVSLDESIKAIKNFDWVIFTSRNGVEHFWKRLEKSQQDARAFSPVKIVAIGPATRDALVARGIHPDYVPESSISENVAQGLIAQGVSGKRVLLARALEGREVIETTLRESGAEVVVVPCYRNTPDAARADEVREKLLRGEIDWISFTSSSTVTNFVTAIGGDILSAARETFRVACIGPVTEKTARDINLIPDVVAHTATVESLIEAMIAAG